MIIRILYMLVFAVVLTAGAWLFWYLWENNRVRQAINKLLAELDIRYTDFVEKRITLNILEDEDAKDAFSLISRDAERILKPELDALYATLETAPLLPTSLKYHSPYFAAIIALIESKGGSYKGEQDLFAKAALYQAFKDAIDADLAKRELDHKVGSSL
ncbi:MAG: hypothetical protein AAF696_16420 [Bacteroidota bacterium]